VKNFEKINLDSKESYERVSSLISNGMSEGTLKRLHGISRRSYYLIKNNLIETKLQFVECQLCNSHLEAITDSHLRYCSSKSYAEYLVQYPDSKIYTLGILIKKSKAIAGTKRSEEEKARISKSMTGKKHSAEALSKLSFLSAGDKNPAKRLDVRKKLKANHVANTDPERWREIVEKNAAAKRGIPLSDAHKQALAEGRERSSKYGSKAQLYAYKYIKKYFGIFHKLQVISNDSSPFKGHTDAFNVDITIPELKIAIEWDGPLHREPIFGDEHLAQVQANDKAKDYLLKSRGWKVIRVIDDCPDGNSMKKYVKEKCRSTVRNIL